jgi:magnesium chelatase subunit D
MENKTLLNLSDPFWRGLACAALNPGLRGVLAFDAEPTVLRMVATQMAQLLEGVTGQRVRLVVLGTTETEEELWGHWTLGRGETVLEWQSGLLTTDEWRLVLIPDLAQLSVAAARACVALMGAEVTHVERQGQQQRSQPKLCWLAGCRTNEVGRVSPHLLDRFAVRLNGKVETSTDRVEDLLRWLNQTGAELETEPLSKEIEERLRVALQAKPHVLPEAIAHIFNYLPEGEAVNLRRQMALLRLAIADAKLEGLDRVTIGAVSRAAGMIGLTLVSQPTMPEAQPPVLPEEPAQPPCMPELQIDDGAIASEPLLEDRSIGQEPVYQSDEPEILPAAAIDFETPTNPYPEDTQPVQREAASLQLPLQRYQTTRTARGAIIGVEPAIASQDLALVNTLLEAVKWQKIRRDLRYGQQRARQTGLILAATDLRRYRRAPVAEQMLVLVLDYTCLRDCRWREALLPYLSWAYVERASVCLVQVGVMGAEGAQSKPNKISSEDLRARKTLERSILVPRFSLGIEAGRGRATPLAHGLDLAVQTLQHGLQHGRSTLRSAVLVVVSDGRGNVPLAASRLGRITEAVGRQGVEDAVQVAIGVRRLERVRTVLLNPQPRQYPELPLELAKAMGAKVVMIPPLETWEVDE